MLQDFFVLRDLNKTCYFSPVDRSKLIFRNIEYEGDNMQTWKYTFPLNYGQTHSQTQNKEQNIVMSV